MTHSWLIVLAASLAVSSTTVAREISLKGEFSNIDRTGAACGVLSVGSQATFVTQSGKVVTVVIPCPEMQLAKSPDGGSEQLKIHRSYLILVSSSRPQHLDISPSSPKALYFISASRLEH